MTKETARVRKILSEILADCLVIQNLDSPCCPSWAEGIADLTQGFSQTLKYIFNGPLGMPLSSTACLNGLLHHLRMHIDAFDWQAPRRQTLNKIAA